MYPNRSLQNTYRLRKTYNKSYETLYTLSKRFQNKGREDVLMNTQPVSVERKQEEPINFVKVEESRQFKNFMHAKKKFIVPLTIFFLVFYFTLPILTSYTTFLNAPFFGDISWVWVFAISQFIMTWVLSMIYVKKANRFDEMAEEIVKEQLDKGGNR